MIIHRNIDSLAQIHKAVITIGSFDGVHHGHQKIVQQLTNQASKINGSAVVISFHPHPRHILKQHSNPLFLLNTLEEKAILLEKMGIDHLVVIPFTEDFSNMSPESYIENFLIAKFKPHSIVIGYDHRYGKGRNGGYELFEKYAAKGLFNLIEIPAHTLEQATISSTLIRTKLLEGEVAAANELLGYAYSFQGLVVHGNALGRTFGYPTANLQILDEHKLIPGYGVYIVTIKDETGSLHKGMLHIGNRPSINDSNRSIEVHIFDFNRDIYGESLTIYLREKLREIVPFSSKEALISQLKTDEKNARDYFLLLGESGFSDSFI
jgi:riboflavin kinase/FMN adenylyltransferase